LSGIAMEQSPKVVAPVISKDEAREALELGADIAEIRYDLAGVEAEGLVESIYDEVGCPIILTIRPVYEGGSFKGTDEERALLFRKLARYADYVDVELHAKNLEALLEATQGGKAKRIVSSHNFELTPSNSEMLSILERSLEKGDIAKLSVMPRDMKDVLRLIEVSLVAPKPFCTISMGSLGMHSRLLTPVYGSCMTYGYVRRPVAPGQLRVDKLLEGLKILGLR